ncbi:MAG: DUF4007 family protein [Clostridia bacterium]|nr:DUF4007 family protein [Clostridia bacterium]
MKIRAHETFCVRKGWIRKGVKNIILNNRLFTDKEVNPCDVLGIGANMVKSLRYWLNVVGIMEEVPDGNQKIQRLTELGRLIDDRDKYFEEDGTNWVLHYQLAKNEDLATAWYWFFNVFKMTSFNKVLFVNELKDFLFTQYDYSCSDKMLEDEFDCLLRTYYLKDKDKSPENTNICPLTELGMIDEVVTDDKGIKEYKKVVPDKDTLHPLIVFGVICDQAESKEILISDLMDKPCNIARIFNLDRSACFYYLEQLQKMGYIDIIRTAGLDVIKLNRRSTFVQAIEQYYTLINGGELQ